MNDYFKCEICGAIFVIRNSYDRTFILDDHLKEKHQIQFEEMEKAKSDLAHEISELEKKYPKKDISFWFKSVEKTNELKEQFKRKYPTQEEIIELMKTGWQLCKRSYSFDAGFYFCLQEGGAGKGGNVKTIKSTQVDALFKKGLILIDKEGYNITTYKVA